MEEIRSYPLDEDESWHRTDEERNYEAAVKRKDDEVPFHVPRD